MSRRIRLGVLVIMLPVVLLAHSSSATAVNAVGFGGPEWQEPFDVTAFPDGSMVAVGQFEGSMTVGGVQLTSVGRSDVFAIRLAPDGSVAWAASAGGTGDDVALGVTALPDGSVVVTGHFAGTATFGETILTSAGGRDIFIARIGPDGAWQWATRGGGSSDEIGGRIATAPDGSVLAIGTFFGVATFGDISLTSAGASDVFLARVAADGTWMSATRAGGDGTEFAGDLVVLSDGSAIVVGSFSGVANFGGAGAVAATASGQRDVFVAKVAVDGNNLTWTRVTRAGGANPSDVAEARAVAAVGSDGTVLVAGEFEGSATFGAHPMVTSAGGRDVFVARIRPDGSWDWVASGGGATHDEDVVGIAVRSDGSGVVVGGLREGSATFGDETVSTESYSDAFVASITASGTWSSVTMSGDPSTASLTSGVFPRGVTVLADGAIGIVGSFEGLVSFGATTLTSSPPRGIDIFFARIGPTGGWLEWDSATPGPVAPAQSSGPTLDCVVEGPVGALRVACAVRGAVPEVDILWRATYNPVLASDGVTPGTDGSGVFSFALPAGVAGSVVNIELVEWLAPVSVRVPQVDVGSPHSQGGPIPVRIPAGNGGPKLPAQFVLLLLFGVGAFLSGRAQALDGGPRKL